VGLERPAGSGETGLAGMSGNAMIDALRAMTDTKSLTINELHELVKEGLAAALARHFGAEVESEIELSGDSIEIVVLKDVVEEITDPGKEISLQEARLEDPEYEVGDLMEIPVRIDEFGLHAVGAARQRIMQLVREGERERIRAEFGGRIGDLLPGEIQSTDRGRLSVVLTQSWDAEAVIPWREQNPRERFRQGEVIRAVLKEIEETQRGPRLILSRSAPRFVAALFSLEVPEIHQNIVEIKGIVREAGGRTKVAVASNDESVDPVGACVGLKGSRVQAIVNELGGERIDIVPWHPDPEVFSRRALAPARVARVFCDQRTKVITAIVDEDQLSLAIGRNGQNVRLASALIGWRIDLYSTRDWVERGGQSTIFRGEDEYEVADFPLSELDGIPPAVLVALEAAGISTFYRLLEMEKGDFLKVPGVGQEDADQLETLIDELTVTEDTSGQQAAKGAS